MNTARRRAASRTLMLSVVAATALACNAILGAGDYKVGTANEDGGGVESGGGGAGTGTAGTGGGKAGAGGGRAGAGGGRAGAGGSNTGGSGMATGGAGGSGGKGAGGKATGGAGAAGSGAGAGGAGGAGTGGAAGASTGGPGAFIGPWTTDNETLYTDCGDGMPTSDSGPDEIDWAAGPSSGTIQTILPTAECALVATVSAKVATLPKTTCMDTSGITYVASGTFTIQADGTARLLETVTISSAGVSCTIDAGGIFTKE